MHRIGRTGRAGRKGVAVTFFTDEDKAHAGELMRVLKDSGNVRPFARSPKSRELTPTAARTGGDEPVPDDHQEGEPSDVWRPLSRDRPVRQGHQEGLHLERQPFGHRLHCIRHLFWHRL